MFITSPPILTQYDRRPRFDGFRTLTLPLEPQHHYQAQPTALAFLVHSGMIPQKQFHRLTHSAATVGNFLQLLPRPPPLPLPLPLPLPPLDIPYYKSQSKLECLFNCLVYERHVTRPAW